MASSPTLSVPSSEVHHHTQRVSFEDEDAPLTDGSVVPHHRADCVVASRVLHILWRFDFEVAGAIGDDVGSDQRKETDPPLAWSRTRLPAAAT